MNLPIIGQPKTEEDMIIQPWVKISYAKLCDILGPASGFNASEWLKDQKLELTTPVPIKEFLFLLQASKGFKVKGKQNALV